MMHIAVRGFTACFRRIAAVEGPLALLDELLVVFWAMVPIGELRAAVPLGIVSYDLSWPAVFLLAALGNMLPIPVMLYLLRTIGVRIEHWDNAMGRLLRWRTSRIELTWGARVRRYGFVGVMLIVAIPLPFTGAWTGSLAVWALQVPVRRGLPAIFAGVLIADVIVTALTLAGVELVKLV
jgi:uncharacterized membrane protein